MAEQQKPLLPQDLPVELNDMSYHDTDGFEGGSVAHDKHPGCCSAVTWWSANPAGLAAPSGPPECILGHPTPFLLAFPAVQGMICDRSPRIRLENFQLATWLDCLAKCGNVIHIAPRYTGACHGPWRAPLGPPTGQQHGPNNSCLRCSRVRAYPSSKA